MSLLEVKDLVVSYGAIKALKGISFDVDAGEVISLIGSNGAGKTTTLHSISNLIKKVSGSISFDGQDITDLAVNERANLGISFAFQQPVRFKGLKVKDLLGIAAGEGVDVTKDCKYLSAVGLCAKDYLNREINDTLSGGEMKRIEIAMAAARGGKLSLFDEPEAGIDLWSFQSLIKVFENLRRVTNGNIMIISHQERILEIADKIIYLKDGEVDRYDEAKKVMTDLNMGRYGCGCAYSQEEGVCNG